MFKDKSTIYKATCVKLHFLEEQYAKFQYGFWEDLKDIIFKVAQKNWNDIQIEDEDM